MLQLKGSVVHDLGHRSPSGHHQASMNDNQSMTTTVGAFQMWLCNHIRNAPTTKWIESMDKVLRTAFG